MIIEQSSNDTTNQQVRQMDLAWLAGFWEGDGDFSIVQGSKSRLFPRATAINTDPLLIEEAARILNEIGVGHYIQFRRGGCTGNILKHKDSKTIMIVGAKRVERFTNLILPHLRGKKKETAGEVSAFTKRRISLGKAKYDSIDFEYVKRVRTLNQKGPFVTSETTRQPSPECAREDIVQVV